MVRVSYYLQRFMDWFHVSDIKIMDIVEILIIALIIYNVLVFIKNTKAWMLMKGIIVLLIFLGIAVLLNMQTIVWMFKAMASLLAVGLVVVFQPELRRALEKLGERTFLNKILPFSLDGPKNGDLRFSDNIKEQIADACFEMGEAKTGALVIIEKKINLHEIERTGISLDAEFSKQLLMNIFEHNTPLHDGAVIIRDERIVAATCYLPLSDNLSISKSLGTRHRAALGASEVSDALIIIISEETGNVSVAHDGRIYIDLTKEELIKHLSDIQTRDVGLIAPKREGGKDEEE